MTVEPISRPPRLEQPFEISNAEPPTWELLQKGLVAEVLDDFVYQGKARRLNSRREVGEVGDHLPPGPALVGVPGGEQGTNNACGLRRTKVRPTARL